MTRHFGEVVGEPQTQDSFVTVKTDSHVAKAGSTNPGCNTLPPVGTMVPRGVLGPAGTQTRPRRKVGAQRPPGPPRGSRAPGHSGRPLVWRHVDTSRRWFAFARVTLSVRLAPPPRGAVSLNSERSQLRGQLWAAVSFQGWGQSDMSVPLLSCRIAHILSVNRRHIPKPAEEGTC